MKVKQIVTKLAGSQNLPLSQGRLMLLSTNLSSLSHSQPSNPHISREQLNPHLLAPGFTALVSNLVTVVDVIVAERSGRPPCVAAASGRLYTDPLGQLAFRQRAAEKPTLLATLPSSPGWTNFFITSCCRKLAVTRIAQL